MGVLTDIKVRIAADISGFRSGMAQVKSDIKENEGVAKGFGGALKSSMAEVATLGVGAGVGLIAAGGAALHMAADFQTSMTALVTGAGESKANIDLVSKGILSMAGDVGLSAGELSKGMYMIESAGFHGAAGLTVLRTAAMGAKVGSADMATVADALTSALNAYHLPASQATAVTNDLIATVASGKMHMQDLAGSLGAVLPAASAAGVSLDQVTGAIATMTMQGTPAADAATYLRQTILQLENPSAKAQKALKDIGLSSHSLANEIGKGGLVGTLEMATDALSKKFAPGSSEYVAHLADMVGGTKSMQAALELTGGNMDTFTANVNAINGAVAEGGNKVLGWSDVQGDFNQKFERSKDALDAAAISVGTRLLPIASSLMSSVIIPALPKIAEFANSFMDTAQVVAVKLTPAFQTLAADVPPAFNVIKTGVMFLNDHREVLAGIAGAVVTLMVPAFLAWTVATWAQVVALTAQAVAMLAAYWPLLLIAVAIGIVIAIVVLLVQHWNVVRDTAINVWNDISSAVGNAAGAVGGALGSIIDKGIAMMNWWNGLPGRLLGIGADMARNLANGFGSIHIPLPHFSMSGGFDPLAWAQGHDLPSLSVNWYKAGGIFNGPSVIGVGEAGTEAVAPISDLAKYMPQSSSSEELLAAVQAMPAQIAEHLAAHMAGGSSTPSRFGLQELAAALYALMAEAEHGRQLGHRSFA